jgi:hypothetical protein
MTEKEIAPVSINEIRNRKFYIPSYQRGYRWTAQEVTDLLDDIWEFSQEGEKKGEFYCLQPVVVRKRMNGSYEVIDGQQRLTTIFIILAFLGKRMFEIEFATRERSREFLEKITNTYNDTNIDYYYMSEAYKTVKDWFENKEEFDLEGTIKEEFSITLGKYTKILWYEPDITEEQDENKEAIGIFTRLNSGKIPLTNSELIKALLLQAENFGNDIEKINLKQIEIAGEWDRIEYALRNDEFWYFITNETAPTSTRIELLFDLITGKQPNHDDFYTFREFYKDFNIEDQESKEEKVTRIWKKVKDYFMAFEEWFNNRQLYHLIGYILAVGTMRLSGIKDHSENISKTRFLEFLKNHIRSTVVWDLSSLNYEDDHAMLTKVLLLFNIITELTFKESNSRFPYHRYKGKGNKKLMWSLEHIHAQNSDGLTKQEQWKGWLESHKNSLRKIDAVKFADLIREIDEKLPSINESMFKDISVRVLQTFRDYDQEEEMHGIQNLALLDKDTNSALNCSTFDVKRTIIIERELRGIFIPVCTKNVFLKYYSDPTSDPYYWNRDDRKRYYEQICEMLKDYLPENKPTNNQED